MSKIFVDEDILREYVSEKLKMNFDACRIDYLIWISNTIAFQSYKINRKRDLLKNKILDYFRIMSN